MVRCEGLDHLTHEPHGAGLALGIAEVGVAVLVIGSVVRGFRQLRARLASGQGHQSHPGVDWIDICLGAMLAVEAYAKYDSTGRIARPMIVLAFSMVAIGLLHGRLAAWGDRRRELRITDDGISVPGAFFRRTTLPWTDLDSIAVTDREAVLQTCHYKALRLDFADLTNPTAIREALATASARLEELRHGRNASIESTAPDS